MSPPLLRKRPLASLFAAAAFVAVCAWATALLEGEDPDRLVARADVTEVRD